MNLLQQSATRETLDAIEKRPGFFYCPYLRTRQKPLDKKGWLVDGKRHLGAHFPLAVFTKNASSRSPPVGRRRTYLAEEKFRRSARTGNGNGNNGPLLHVTPNADYQQSPWASNDADGRPPLHVTPNADCPQSRGPSGAADYYHMAAANDGWTASSNEGTASDNVYDWTYSSPAWTAFSG